MKQRTPLISGQICLHQRCPLIGERTVVFIYLLFLAGHMYQRGTCILLSFFLLKMVSVMIELHCHKKIVTYLTKTLKWLLYDIITKSKIYTSACSQMFYRIVGVFKGVLKNFANFTGKHLCREKCERKSFTLSMQPATSL